MSLPLPELDDLEYDDLLREALESIPVYAPRWTDRNPSDPGITVLELLAWVGEAILYRVNDVSDHAYLNFLRMLAGMYPGEAARVLEEYAAEPARDPEYLRLLTRLHHFESGLEPAEAAGIQETAAEYLKAPYRIITENDIQDHFHAALNELGDATGGLIKCTMLVLERELRIHCVAREHALAPGNYEFSRNSIMELRAEFKSAKDPNLSAAAGFLEKWFMKRKPAGTRMRVKVPPSADARLEFQVAPRPLVEPGEVLRNAVTAAMAFLDPVDGAFASSPARFDLSVEALHHAITRAKGVLNVDSLVLTIREPGGESSVVRSGSVRVRGMLQLEKIHAQLTEL